MNVWPTVSVTGFPSESKNWVGAVIDFLRQVPLMVLPLVAIQALPVPMMSASRRCFLLAVVERPEGHRITIDVLRRHPLAVGLVDLLASRR